MYFDQTKHGSIIIISCRYTFLLCILLPFDSLVATVVWKLGTNQSKTNEMKLEAKLISIKKQKQKKKIILDITKEVSKKLGGLSLICDEKYCIAEKVLNGMITYHNTN